eukprot:173472-Hanusia_phi.AAC.2
MMTREGEGYMCSALRARNARTVTQRSLSKPLVSCDPLPQGLTTICMDYGTFVCTSCAGIHREFQHKTKTISMSNWTLEEVDRRCIVSSWG